MGQNINRRAALFGAAVSTVSLAVPAVAAIEKVYVRVGSPSFSVPPEVMVAIKKWRAAHRQYAHLQEVAKLSVLPPWRQHEDNPAEDAAIRAMQDENEARNAMLTALLQA